MSPRTVALFVCLAGLVTDADAASVSLAYAGANPIAGDGAILVADGDVLTFDIIWDFSGPGEATLGGGHDVVFDSSLLRFESFAFDPAICGISPCQLRDPDILDGVVEGVAFGSLSPIVGPARLAFVTFTYTGAGFQGDTVLWTRATTGYGGPFISALDGMTVIDVDFGSTTLRAVPLPAALWLFLGALGTLAQSSRR